MGTASGTQRTLASVLAALHQRRDFHATGLRRMLVCTKVHKPSGERVRESQSPGQWSGEGWLPELSHVESGGVASMSMAPLPAPLPEVGTIKSR